MWYEALWFVEGMECYSVHLLSWHGINLRMHRDVIAAEVEASDVLWPTDQDCWVVVDADTLYFLCVCDFGYQCYVVLNNSEVENGIWCWILGHKCVHSVLGDIDLFKAKSF